MQIPDTLVLLGEPIEIETETGERWEFGRNRFYFASTMDGRSLWILPKPPRKKPISTIPKKAANLFKRFTGWHPDKAHTFLTEKVSLKSFGTAKSVSYRSNKWSGRQVSYIHDFENRTLLQVDNKKNPGIWRISGHKLKVEAVGITG